MTNRSRRRCFAARLGLLVMSRNPDIGKKSLSDRIIGILVWAFPAVCLIYGLASYLYPGVRIGEFNDGFAVELVGFAFTILFFDLVLLKRHEAQRQKKEEQSNNLKISSVLRSDVDDLKHALCVARTNLLVGADTIKLARWGTPIPPEQFAEILKPDSTTHIKPRGTIQRGLHQPLDAFETTKGHLTVLLPTVKTHTEDGELFEDHLMNAFTLAKKIERYSIETERMLRICPAKTEEFLKNPHCAPQNLVFQSAKKFTDAYIEFVDLIASACQLLESKNTQGR